MDETESQKVEPASGRVPFRERRRLHFHLGAWSIFTLGMIALFLTLLSMSITGRAVTLPDWVAERVEQKINDAMPEGALTLRRIELGVTRAGRPRLRLVDVGLKDASGLDIAQLNQIEGGVRLAPLFRGEFVPRYARLGGAQITFRRLADGSFALQFGQGNTATGSLADMLDAVDAVFADGILSEAGRVEATGLTIALEDARTGRIWQVTSGSLSVTQTDQLVETQVRFDVFNQTDELANVELSLRSSKTTSEAAFSVSLENALASDIGAQSPALSFLQLVDAPVSGALRTTIGADGTITNLAGVLEIEEGAIKPAPGATPVGFGGARGYVDYDPKTNSIALSGLSLNSDLGEAALDGKLILADFAGGWPQEVQGQIRLTNGRLNDPNLFDEEVQIESGYADMRLRFSPFRFDIGQAVVFHNGTKYAASGQIKATREEWDLAFDIEVPSLDVAELKSVWPRTVSTNARTWVFDRVEGGDLSDVTMALRGPSLKDAQLLLGGKMQNGEVKVLPTLPKVEEASGYLSIADRRLVVSVASGTVTAPSGGKVDAAGTTFTIPDVKKRPGDGIAQINLSGPLHAGLALLNEPPVSALKQTDLEPDFASGRFEATGEARFPMLPQVPFDLIDFNVTGKAFDISTDKLIPGQTLTAEVMDFAATQSGVELTGAARIGEVDVNATWRQPIGPDAAGQGSTVTGQLQLGQTLVQQFNLGLSPQMLSGQAPANFTLSLGPDGPPKLSAQSDLVGVSLAIPGTGWSKPSATSGDLSLEVTLGPTPEVTALTLDAAGLKATGTITTREDGGLDRATFSRVQLGGWLDAPVTLAAQNNGALRISVLGGSADLRNAGFASGGGGTPSARSQPLSIQLDRLTIAEGMVLRDFAGAFDLGGGLSGTFTARVEGGGPIEGTVAQTDKGAAYRITAANGGRVLKGLGVFQQARGGQLEVVLAPTGSQGTYEGSLNLKNTRLVDAPAMAELLAALSIVGLIDQLDGQGISFSEVKARFRLSPGQLTLYSSSAVSASMGLSMDGYYNLNDKTLDMQGTLSPIYIINSLGRVLSARDGEGLVGFSFTLTGPGDDIKVNVNPLSILTPGFLREIFRREAPTQPVEE